MQGGQPPQPGGQIQIRDNLAGGEYANAMQVAHREDEFLLTFLNIVAPTGRVVGKIITSPGHLKRIIRALEENLKRYESTFGTVKEAESPKNEIGFHPSD
ncbi:MAG: hypothetical protein A2731_03905 [Candidatus Buchananbacteria bacterium RIFCSPHIGHO2_01_FULL_39_8]|uniref:DUF3467 domain-containing protein n=1 Tax=Candidatus Buchananbacteria bacterium RIFCSPHIGHO2_01_FULL_39_8 TaxID=1797533 RepID=A0A1G1XWW7_9BACT|nr:MAG: hypothetical protein A2731_03905 [Candidatus Buchananbacteria bacterium RIFCSPHIGHO2_01_FULL_39_8]